LVVSRVYAGETLERGEITDFRERPERTIGLNAAIATPPGSGVALAEDTVALSAGVPRNHALLPDLRILGDEPQEHLLGMWIGYSAPDGPPVIVDLRLQWPELDDFTLMLRIDLTDARLEHVRALAAATRLLILLSPVDDADDPTGELLTISAPAPPDPDGQVLEAHRRLSEYRDSAT
jgi:hypothetical protein